jgi:hypothetical protein
LLARFATREDQRVGRNHGLRRRIHDTRRTMITLALNDGARRDVFQGITHGNKGDIIDLYNSPLWSLKCQEMAKLRIRRVPPAGLGTVLGTVGVDAEENFGDLVSSDDRTRIPPARRAAANASECQRRQGRH